MRTSAISRRFAAANDGFTMVEMLVSILILSVMMTAIFSFLWGASRYWQSGQAAAEVTENARLGLNRMTREIKQASGVTEAYPTQVSFSVDFGDGAQTITYGFTPGMEGSSGQVWRTSTTSPGQSVLMDNVEAVQFIYYGNDYRCDSDGDGLATFEELQLCSSTPLTKISRVDIELTMRAGDDSPQSFDGQAWLRNRTT